MYNQCALSQIIIHVCAFCEQQFVHLYNNRVREVCIVVCQFYNGVFFLYRFLELLLLLETLLLELRCGFDVKRHISMDPFMALLEDEVKYVDDELDNEDAYQPVPFKLGINSIGPRFVLLV